MMNETTETSAPAKPSVFTVIQVKYQNFLDSLVPHKVPRWVAAVVLLCIYALRVLVIQGWYIITYALAIYLLNLFIAFISPKFDPLMEDEEETDDGPQLPTSRSDEFKPFIRRLPEFKFWLSLTRATLIALFCTCFSFFNIPVFWPILVLYFIILFSITMKRQIKHMIRFRYLPFNYGKRRYKGKDDMSSQ